MIIQSQRPNSPRRSRSGSRPAQCSFVQGDACDLDSCSAVAGRQFDCVLGA